MIDEKNLYIIYDVKGHSYGELMTFTNDSEAMRSFIYACANTNFFADLVLLEVGHISFFVEDSRADDFDMTCIPTVNGLRSSLVCRGSEIADEVNAIIQKNNEKTISLEEMRKSYANKFEQHFDSLFKLRKIKGGK